ncbi:uncharacterized protein B0H18DRAFT_137341 [Fomitopsis serialis]|uniref:uncharacterized protein n=1 Tax=Fomitopsis serialis TaxID=139415 RepID=UPI002008128B|nr:uncharacterized protein B0H18DRAFT_137341 [Neoantrodia serialis]KAH9914353.1 hypothetical protein B0H18DRAFT_137341 [Neoantrodia serialis]
MRIPLLGSTSHAGHIELVFGLRIARTMLPGIPRSWPRNVERLGRPFCWTKVEILTAHLLARHRSIVASSPCAKYIPSLALQYLPYVAPLVRSSRSSLALHLQTETGCAHALRIATLYVHHLSALQDSLRPLGRVSHRCMYALFTPTSTSHRHKSCAVSSASGRRKTQQFNGGPYRARPCDWAPTPALGKGSYAVGTEWVRSPVSTKIQPVVANPVPLRFVYRLRRCRATSSRTWS